MVSCCFYHLNTYLNECSISRITVYFKTCRYESFLLVLNILMRKYNPVVFVVFVVFILLDDFFNWPGQLVNIFFISFKFIFIFFMLCVLLFLIFPSFHRNLSLYQNNASLIHLLGYHFGGSSLSSISSCIYSLVHSTGI